MRSVVPEFTRVFRILAWNRVNLTPDGRWRGLTPDPADEFPITSKTLLADLLMSELSKLHLYMVMGLFPLQETRS